MVWCLILVSLPALPEAVAFAVHLQDVHVVSEAVQESAGEPFRAEDVGPYVEGQVGGNEVEQRSYG